MCYVRATLGTKFIRISYLAQGRRGGATGGAAGAAAPPGVEQVGQTYLFARAEICRAAESIGFSSESTPTPESVF